MQITTLLVPHDGSWMADRALACATMLQGATGARLDLLRIAPDLIPGMQSPSGPTAGVTDIWDRASTVDHGTDLDDPVTIILDAIERRRPDLVVMPSDSWSIVGLGVDIARQVARRSPVPILLIPTDPESFRDDHDVRRILVALDGSESAEQALTPAGALADALEADMLLLRVVTPKHAVFGGRAPDDDLDLPAARRYVEALADALQKTGRRASALAVVGEPGTMIAAVSRTQRAGMLAMTTRGKCAIRYSEVPMSPRDTMDDEHRPFSRELGGIANSSLQSVGMPLLLVPTFSPIDRDDRSLSSILTA